MTGNFPDSKIYGANMGPNWGRQELGGPQMEPMSFATWVNSISVANNNPFILHLLYNDCWSLGKEPWNQQ